MLKLEIKIYQTQIEKEKRIREKGKEWINK